MASTNDVLYSVRAKHQGEAIAHCRKRLAFLRDLIADDHTETLFAVWREQDRIDNAIATIVPYLDRIAAVAGFESRAVFRADGRALRRRRHA